MMVLLHNVGDVKLSWPSRHLRGFSPLAGSRGLLGTMLPLGGLIGSPI